MSDQSDQRALAIESLRRRTERGLTELGQAIGGYRGICEAMDAQLLRKDARIEQLETEKVDLLAALELIRENGCHNYYVPLGACITLRPDGRLSEYSADSWCDSCIAHEAITKATAEVTE